MSHPPIDQQITFLYTRDLARSARFYEEVLGLPLALDQGGCRIYRVSAGGYVGICQRTDAPEQPAGVILTLVTPAVDEWCEHLRAHGVVLEKEPAVNPDYGIYHCFLRDPNGYLVEIQRFLDLAWDAS
ncbi:MAG: VOC family protein [Chloroflexi bacterium]|nr:VOC family protein [Chloroflexota bacterium]MBU1748765.1 VOC family protein [Chloroflexota bacterium]MBU1879500.1 VOC family protein [Chloroflexota bacterium]